jgi:hypothetical protein
VVEEMKRFVQSPIQSLGDIGYFNLKHPLRHREYDIHDGKISNRSVARWKSESNKELLSDAVRLFDLMPEYADYWQYIK